MGNWTWARLAMKSWAILDSIMEAGREFHSGMVLGKNENFSQLVLDHRYIYFCSWLATSWDKVAF